MAITMVIVIGVLIGFLTDLDDGWERILTTLTWISLSLVFHYLTIWFRTYPELVEQYQQIRFGSAPGFAIILRLTTGLPLNVRSGPADFVTLSGLVLTLYGVLYTSISAWLARSVSISDRVQGR